MLKPKVYNNDGFIGLYCRIPTNFIQMLHRILSCTNLCRYETSDRTWVVHVFVAISKDLISKSRYTLYLHWGILDPCLWMYQNVHFLFTYEQADKYQVLDQLLNDDSFHEAQRLCSCLKSKQLQHVADTKGKRCSLFNSF